MHRGRQRIKHNAYAGKHEDRRKDTAIARGRSQVPITNSGHCLRRNVKAVKQRPTLDQRKAYRTKDYGHHHRKDCEKDSAIIP